MFVQTKLFLGGISQNLVTAGWAVLRRSAASFAATPEKKGRGDSIVSKPEAETHVCIASSFYWLYWRFSLVYTSHSFPDWNKRNTQNHWTRCHRANGLITWLNGSIINGPLFWICAIVLIHYVIKRDICPAATGLTVNDLIYVSLSQMATVQSWNVVSLHCSIYTRNPYNCTMLKSEALRQLIIFLADVCISFHSLAWTGGWPPCFPDTNLGLVHGAECTNCKSAKVQQRVSIAQNLAAYDRWTREHGCRWSVI